MSIHIKRYLAIVLVVVLVGIYLSILVAFGEWDSKAGVVFFVLTFPAIVIALPSHSTLNKWFHIE